MKKYLLALFLFIIASSAHAGWHIHERDGCAINVRFMARDYYYFCGAHESKCNGDWAENTELKNGFVEWYTHGQSVMLNGVLYWCCGGEITSDTKKIERKGKPSGTVGRWVAAPDFYLQMPETKTKAFAGGTCSYSEAVDVCNGKQSTEDDCAAQAEQKVTCPDGTFYRASSGSCTKSCEPGYAYESEKSNRCIECRENAHQGIVSDDGTTSLAMHPAHKICRQCDASSFFNPTTKQCIPKANLTALSTMELQYGKDLRTKASKSVSGECWTKYGTEYKGCVLP